MNCVVVLALVLVAGMVEMASAQLLGVDLGVGVGLNVSLGGTPTPAPIISSTSAPITVTTPAVTTPAVTTPAITTPAVTTPAVTTPAVTTPAITTPAVTTPAITTPSITTPTTPQPPNLNMLFNVLMAFLSAIGIPPAVITFLSSIGDVVVAVILTLIQLIAGFIHAALVILGILV